MTEARAADDRPADDRLRVVESMLTVVPGGMGGSETYARALVRRLEARPDVDVRTVLPRDAAGLTGGGTELVLDRVHGGRTPTGRLLTLARAAAAGRQVRGWSADAQVVHVPFSTVVPDPAPGQALVQTLHDVQHLDLPELFGRGDKLYRRFTYERDARRADVVITVSRFAKDRIVHHLGIDAAKVHVAHLGVDTERFRPTDAPREDFLYYPARGWAHKNHRTLVEAVRLLRERHPGLRLVLTGGALEGLGELPEWVEVRGLVTDAEVADLYRRARALVFPSRYEGFGLPPLEAMACGTPVAASRAGSLPEVCGDAAVLFEPDDPAAIAAGVEEAFDRSADLATRGVAHARTFTWDACTDAHVAAFRAALA
jgi:glycosyltransferase involved in cell wall biosynthesis